MIKPNYEPFVDTIEDAVDQNLTILAHPNGGEFKRRLLSDENNREAMKLMIGWHGALFQPKIDFWTS